MRRWLFITAGILAIGVIISCTFLYFKTQKNILDIEDQKSIVETVNKYYKSIEEKKFESALILLSNDKMKVRDFQNIDTKVFALEQLFNTTYEQFVLDVPCTTDKISYDNSIGQAFAYVALSIKYRDVKQRSLNEVLYLTKDSGNWKICKIESSDIFVPYRTSDYSVVLRQWEPEEKNN